LSTKYTIDAKFERTLCAALFISSSAWRTLGAALRPEAMPTRMGELAVKLASLAAGDAGDPGGIPVAYQRAEEVAAIGGKDAADMAKLMAWLEHGFDDLTFGGVRIEPVVRTGIEAVRKFEVDNAAEKLLENWSQRKDTESALDAYARAKGLGGVLDRGSEALSVASRLAILRSAQNHDVIPIGKPEFDACMDGGLAIGNVGLILGGSGDGKSTSLLEICAYTSGRLKKACATASCELRDRQSVLKFEAALWGIPINAIKANPDLVAERYEQRGHEVAPFAFRHWDLDHGKPTIGNVFDWVDSVEQQTGTKIEMIGIDHFDRFDPSRSRSKKGEYEKGEIVYDEIATNVHDRKMVAWVPTQAVRKKTSALWGPGDMAHSHHKEKRADAVFSVNAGGKPGARTMTCFMFKNREGEANVVIGPRNVGFAYGRLFDDTAILDEEVY
jgi:hypothetical protein